MALSVYNPMLSASSGRNASWKRFTSSFPGELSNNLFKSRFRYSKQYWCRAWQRLVDEGHLSGIHELAQAIGHDHSYVSRIMRLATLSPRFVEAIVDGAEMPTTLSVARARKAFPLL